MSAIAIKPLRERNPVLVGIVGLAILIAAALIAFDAGNISWLGGGGTHYDAYFAEAAGLKSGDEVRVAGVRVGKVTSVALDGAKVKVGFQVKHTWIGNASTVGIAIRTLLGAKYLAVDPLGAASQDPHTVIPTSRTTSPYDVTEAFNGLTSTIGQLNTQEMSKSLETLSQTFAGTPPDVRKALDGLSSLSQTISSRDNQLSQLLAGTRQITATLDGENGTISTLLSDGNQLLAELQSRRDAIHQLLVGAQQLGTQLTGLVQDDQKQLDPTLKAVQKLTTVLVQNQSSLDKTLKLSGPYFRLMANSLGTGHWFDSYLCGLVPQNYLPAGTGLPDSGCTAVTPLGGAKK